MVVVLGSGSSLVTSAIMEEVTEIVVEDMTDRMNEREREDNALDVPKLSTRERVALLLRRLWRACVRILFLGRARTHGGTGSTGATATATTTASAPAP